MVKMGRERLDRSAFVLLFLYLLRFIFTMTFQVIMFKMIVLHETPKPKSVIIFLSVMLAICPVFLNMGYFFYVYEMYHVKILLEAPNEEVARVRHRRANIGRAMTMLFKISLFALIIIIDLAFT